MVARVRCFNRQDGIIARFDHGGKVILSQPEFLGHSVMATRRGSDLEYASSTDRLNRVSCADDFIQGGET